MPEQRPPIDKTKSMFLISRFRILLTVDEDVIPAIIETIFFVGILFAMLFPKPGIFAITFFMPLTALDAFLPTNRINDANGVFTLLFRAAFPLLDMVK